MKTFMKNILSTLVGLSLLVSFAAQTQIPTPASAQQKPMMITGATIHVGNGQTIENGTVAFENGKLTYVGAASSAPSDQSKYDASGRLELGRCHIRQGRCHSSHLAWHSKQAVRL